jgi:hypothetical protein
MTTWEECYYTTDTIAKIVQSISRTDDDAAYAWKTFGFDAQHPDTYGCRSQEDLMNASGLRKLFPLLGCNKNPWLIKQLKAITAAHDSVCFGLSGIYNIIQHIYDGDIEAHHEVQFGKMRQFTKTMVQINLLGSLATPKKIAPMIEETALKGEAFSQYANFLQTAAAIQHLAFFWRSKTQSDANERAKRCDDPFPMVRSHEITFGKSVTSYSLPGMIIMSVTRRKDGKKFCYILVTRQAKRYELTIRAIARAIYYYNTAYSGHALNMFNNVFEEFIRSLTRTQRHNEVARAWDVMFNLYMASVATDVTDRALKLQSLKMADNKYDKMIQSEYILKILSGLGVETALDFLKLYKVLPSPDFNPTTGFMEMKKLHNNPHSFMEPHPTLANKYPEIVPTLDEFRYFRDLQLLRRLHKKFGYIPCPLKPEAMQYMRDNPTSYLHAYPRVSPNTLTRIEQELIEIENAGVWEYRNSNSPEHYSDKACAPQRNSLDSISDSESFYKLPIWERNYTAWYIHQSEIPSCTDLRKQFLDGGWKNEQIAYFKPESKKDNPRNFYSAKPYSRMVMSELEDNVSRYMSHDVASFQSKDPKERANALASLLGNNNMAERRRLIFISFDLEKFSPQMPAGAKDLSMEIWTKFFDTPNKEAFRALYTDTTLHFWHHGIRQKYTVPSVDMEGQTGKMNTAYHEDVMAYGIRLLKRAQYLEESAKLAVFIDDGLLALSFPLGTTNDKITRCLEVLDMVYYIFGLRISWDKTFVSQKICVFLNEIYYKNKYLPIGFKAILKMQLAKVGDELSVLGKNRALCTMARAAIANGVRAHHVYAELCKELFALHNRQYNHIFRVCGSTEAPIVAALWSFTPVGLGGLGVPFLGTLEATPSMDPMSEFCSASEYICNVIPGMDDYFERILMQNFRPRTNLSVLRAPLAFRTTQPVLTEYKHIKYVTAAIAKFSNNNTLNNIVRLDMSTIADSIVTLIGPAPELWILEGAYASSTIAIFDKFIGKFKRSSTIMNLMPIRLRFGLMRKYALEAHLTLLGFLETLRKR